MAASSQPIFSEAFSWIKKFCILVNILQNFVPKGPIDNNPTLI